MKPKILFLIMILIMPFAAAGCNDSSNNVTPSSDSGSKKIVIGLDDTFPPFGFKDTDGEIKGVDIDLAKEVMKRLGYAVEFKAINWADKYKELDSGQIDIIWNGLDLKEDRKQYVLFSRPYMSSGQIVFVRHTGEQSRITSRNKLAGLVIGVQEGSTAEEIINADNDLKFTIKELKLYATYAEAFDALRQRQLDVVVCDETYGKYYLFKNHLDKEIDALNIFVGNRGKTAIGFRKGDTALRDEVQTALDSMIADGTAKRISESWFGTDMIITEQ